MPDLLGHVERSLRERRLLRGGQTVLVAVSGGLDSMVLLDLLQRAAADAGLRLIVAHFNHRLRGRGSDADQRLVEQTAARLGLRCVVGHGDVRGHARRRRCSVEMAARELRHRFLARTARRLSADAVALAHHADDQVELFLVRLLRGASSAGLAGMPWKSPSPVDPEVTLIRPLLDQSRAALRAYAEGRKIRWREDASNRRPDFLRNRIRHELLPLLRKGYQPALDRVVLRLIEQLRGESEFVEQTARRWLSRTRRHGFDTLPVAVQRHCLEMELRRAGIVPGFDLIEQLRQQPGRAVSVSDEEWVERDVQGRVQRRTRSRIASPSRQRLVRVGRAGRVEFGGARLHWRAVAGATARRNLRRKGVHTEYFDAHKIGPKVRLRHWQPGDRFQPSGLSRPVKLQDLFVNLKIPAARRHEMVVAETAGGTIFWVEGLRISEGFKLGPATTAALRWEWRRD